MDIIVPICLIMPLAINLLGIIGGGGSLGNFLDIASIIVTAGGGANSLIMANDIGTVLGVPKAIKVLLQKPAYSEDQIIITLISFSEKARREGLLVLEDDIQEVSDPFLKKGMQLVVDGTDPELVKNILNTEIDNIESRHDSVRKVFDDAASLFPAWGMIGTLIGLVIMLRSLGGGGGLETIGSGMAVALITTYYGSVIANGFALPISGRLAARHSSEAMVKSIMLEGILSIQAGDNPRIVKDKLVSFLPPAQRQKVNEQVGDR
ncbi:MotA/TolQ/ExbB proton channel family protein [Brachyspira innocens]|uniref:MotA/TolQ/ExbB proton channel family protein n=1 Tax=Brachyspira innocens TaxID=13264 RepID=A0ABT8YYG1_9SPIR|nr:MotA/TolQ/ExbB proton channel family protein [Brachyspira innocens]MDO6994442.1 MotA/TolQ/ExbB proton channel family protein [Brachyspira innocens]MDO7020267.1 MotA/TolQ/ExbB proton channel family protein [Brachyspira innocens]